jgi:ketosteroid isomerase-like protein
MRKTGLRRVFVVAMIQLVAAALLGTFASTGTARANTPAEAQNIARVQQGFDAWRAGTGSVFDLLAEDATWEVLGNTPVSGLYTSKADLQQRVLAPFNARMSGGLTPTVRALYADGDTVIAFFDASGTARDGLPYHNTYTWYLHMRDGQITAVQALLDSVAFNDLWHRVSP